MINQTELVSNNIPEHTSQSIALLVKIPCEEVYIPTHGEQRIERRKLVELNRKHVLDNFHQFIHNRAFVTSVKRRDRVDHHDVLWVLPEVDFDWEICLKTDNTEMLLDARKSILHHISAWNLSCMAQEELAIRWFNDQEGSQGAYLDLVDYKALDIMF